MRSSSRARAGTAVVLLLATLAGVLTASISAARANNLRAGERSDLNLFLDASSAGWAEATDQFFTVPESAARTIAALSIDSLAEDRIELLAETIRPARALDAAFLGYPDGSFVYVGRSDEVSVGGWRTRTILVDGNQRTVELTWTDAALNVLRSQIDETDSYDPRERPWFIAADNAASEMWTAPYVFESSQQPGITHSSRVGGADGASAAVVGIDMRLTELGEFLDELAPGANGEALVVDDQAQVIAASAMDTPPVQLSEVDNVLSADNTDALFDSIERLQTDPAMVSRDRSPDRQRTTVTRSARTSQEWYLAVQALDDDFLVSNAATSPRSLLRILGLGLAAALVTGTLGFWALRYRQNLKLEAEQDELTGVLSRRAFKRVLTARLRDQNDMVVVAIIDLDRFKAVNDNHGHATGDAVLSQVAARMQSFANEHDAVVGRLGGDEFAMVTDAELDWMQLILALIEPIQVAATEFDVGASIGVAVAKPGHLRSTEELLREADHALFDVKRAGGGDVLIAGQSARTI